MPEQVEILDHTPAGITIFNAMCRAHVGQDVLDKYRLDPKGDATVAEVTLLVNGVEAPVTETLAEYWKKFDALVSEEAAKLAAQVVSDTGLEKIRDELSKLEDGLRSARCEVRDSVTDWMNAQGRDISFLRFDSDD